MSKKPVFKRCISHFERFSAPTDWELGKLFESHFVTTDIGRKCMSMAQFKISYMREGNAWVKR